MDWMYLGDGLYASYDHGQYCLRAPHTGGEFTIYLEPEVLKAFDKYRKSIADQLATKTQGASL
jgi:hypothetical protein